MGKLKIKQKKKAFVPYTNQQANMFAQSIQNCQKELKEMKKKAYEDGFTVGEDWSNTINTVTTMMALRRLYGFSTKRLLDVIRTANEYVEMANRGEMSVLSMMQDIEENTDVRFDEMNKNLVKKMEFKMKFIDFFAGIGGFRRGMELAGHECVGFCEFDKFATASYISMHLLTDEQRKALEDIPIKKRQKEILKEEYRNGEWYANDIRRVYAGDIPKADCWCFGFPCQDISIAGKQVGFQGNRSSLFFRVMYLIGQLKEEDKPTYLFIENVKNLLSVNGG